VARLGPETHCAFGTAESGWYPLKPVWKLNQMNRTCWNQLPNLTPFTFASMVLAFVTIARADGAASPIPETNHKSFTGTISRVDVRARTVAVESLLLTKTFTTRDQCRVQLEDKPIAALDDLQLGQRVEVRYLVSDDAMVATRIIQKNVAFTGHITSFDEVGKLLLVKNGLEAKAFKVSDHCRFTQKERAGAGFADLKLGHKITVRYAPTLRQNLAFKIESSSQVITGTIEALDPDAGTLKTRQPPVTKTFKFGKDCAIVIGGRPGSKIRDLRVGDKIACHFEDVNGVLVANRIVLEAPASAAAETGRAIRCQAMRSPELLEFVR
jgi:hypothetical protein